MSVIWTTAVLKFLLSVDLGCKERNENKEKLKYCEVGQVAESGEAT